MQEDIVVRGIRFHWNSDAEAYEAQVSPEDIEDVYAMGYDEGYDAGYIDRGSWV
jgi:hypothetical protein